MSGSDGRWQIVAWLSHTRATSSRRETKARVGRPEGRIAWEDDREVDTVPEGPRVDLLAEVKARSRRLRRGPARTPLLSARQPVAAATRPVRRRSARRPGQKGHRVGHCGEHQQRGRFREHKARVAPTRRTARGAGGAATSRARTRVARSGPSGVSRASGLGLGGARPAQAAPSSSSGSWRRRCSATDHPVPFGGQKREAGPGAARVGIDRAARHTRPRRSPLRSARGKNERRSRRGPRRAAWFSAASS